MTVIVIFVPINRLHSIADGKKLLVQLLWSYVASKNRYSGFKEYRLHDKCWVSKETEIKYNFWLFLWGFLSILKL